MNEGYSGTVLEFETDNPDFARGFEAGHVWSLLQTYPKKEIGPMNVHISNTEMFIRMSEASGRPVRSRELDDNWMEIWLGKTPEKPPF